MTGTAPHFQGYEPRYEGGAPMEQTTIDVLGCLEEAEARLRELTSGLTEADLDRPTPCTEWDVRALVSHTIGAMEMYAAWADGGPAPDFEAMMSGRDVLAGDPHGAVLASCARSQRAWSQPGVLQRELATPWGPMSGERVAIAKHVLHPRPRLGPRGRARRGRGAATAPARPFLGHRRRSGPGAARSGRRCRAGRGRRGGDTNAAVARLHGAGPRRHRKCSYGVSDRPDSGRSLESASGDVTVRHRASSASLPHLADGRQ